MFTRLIEFLKLRIEENETLAMSIDNDLPQIMSSEEELSPLDFFLSNWLRLKWDWLFISILLKTFFLNFCLLKFSAAIFFHTKDLFVFFSLDRYNRTFRKNKDFILLNFKLCLIILFILEMKFIQHIYFLV